MSITTLNELAIKVVSDMPSFPPENIVLDKLRQAWEEMLDGSELWREELDPIDAVEDQADYTLTPSAGVVIRIISVSVDDTELDPSEYKMTSTDTLTFEEDSVPAEDGDENIDVEVAIAPDINGTNGPAWVLNRMHKGLVAGARYYLYRQLRKPWTDPDPDFRNRDAEKEIFEEYISKCIIARRQHRTTRPVGFSA